jgi:hypothetical protein
LEYFGEDIAVINDIYNRSECIEQCKMNPQCIGLSFFFEINKCVLLSQVTTVAMLWDGTESIDMKCLNNIDTSILPPMNG